MKNKIMISLLVIVFLITGCSNINKLSYDDIVNELAQKNKYQNTINSAYKFNLPNYMSQAKYDNYNSVLVDENYNYYLYVDIVNYYSKTKSDYEICKTCFYSKKIDYEGKTGYVEINLKENNQYLIEIMYNYAKIEVMVDYDDINLAVLNAVTISRDLEYNDMTNESIASNKSQKFNDETYNIFNPKGNDNNYLDIIQNVDDTNAEENEEIDTDLVK